MGRSGRKIIRFFIIVALAHLLVLVVLPALVSTEQFAKQISQELSNRFGRPIAVKKIRINVLTGVVAEELSVTQPAPFATSDSPNQLHVDAFCFRANLFELLGALFGRPIRIEKVHLDGANLDLTFTPDGDNITDLLAALTGSSSVSDSASAMDLNIERIAFTNLELRYTNTVQGVKALKITADSVGAALRYGRLVVDPGTKLLVNGGTITIDEAEFDATNGAENFKIVVHGDNITMDSSLRPSLDIIQPLTAKGFSEILDVDLVGQLSFETTLSGSGYSEEALKSRLVGNVRLELNKGTLTLGNLLGSLRQQAPQLALLKGYEDVADFLQKSAIPFSSYKQEFTIGLGRVHTSTAGTFENNNLLVRLTGSTGFDRTIDLTLGLGGVAIRERVQKPLARLLESGVIRLTGSLDRVGLQPNLKLLQDKSLLDIGLDVLKEKLDDKVENKPDNSDELKKLIETGLELIDPDSIK